MILASLKKNIFPPPIFSSLENLSSVANFFIKQDSHLQNSKHFSDEVVGNFLCYIVLISLQFSTRFDSQTPRNNPRPNDTQPRKIHTLIFCTIIYNNMYKNIKGNTIKRFLKQCYYHLKFKKVWFSSFICWSVAAMASNFHQF
jgi:hypothetical protein